MKLYRLKYTENVGVLAFYSEKEEEELAWHIQRNKPLPKHLQEASVYALDDEHIRQTDELHDSDFLFCLSEITVKEEVMQILDKYIGSQGQWIKLKLGNTSYYSFHVLKCLDAVDEDKSEFIEFKGKKMDIKKYVFKPFDYSFILVFKSLQQCGAQFIVTELFADLLKTHNFTGIRLEELGEVELKV